MPGPFHAERHQRSLDILLIEVSPDSGAGSSNDIALFGHKHLLCIPETAGQRDVRYCIGLPDDEGERHSILAV